MNFEAYYNMYPKHKFVLFLIAFTDQNTLKVKVLQMK